MSAPVITAVVWQCDRSTPTVAAALAAASARFCEQFGTAPTHLDCHPADAPALPATDLIVTARVSAGRGCVWVGAVVEGGAR